MSQLRAAIEPPEQAVGRLHAAHQGPGTRMLRLVRQLRLRWPLILGVAEFSLLILALWLATWIRFFRDPDSLAEFTSHLLHRSIEFAGIIVLMMAALGMYQRHLRESWFGVLARQFAAFVIGAVALAVLYFMIPETYVGRGVLGIALSLGFVGVAVFRAGFERVVDVEQLKRRILVLGAGEQATLIARRMRRRTDRRGFRVVGYVTLGGERTLAPAELVLFPERPLRELAAELLIDEIVVGPDNRRGVLPMSELLDCRQHGIAVTDLSTFVERESGRVRLDVDPSWLVFSDGFNSSQLRVITKRAFDVASAGLLLAFGWPLIVLTAFAVWVESPRAPVLYRQERVGEHGRMFRVQKFRSMRPDAEADGVARWASKNDDRVTRVGKVIRKTRLDELPQLWNVLKGDMSIIGPRPERPQFVEALAGKLRYYPLRHCVKPGLTGWAQLRYPYGSSEDDAAEKLAFDLFYVKNHDFMLDLIVLVQTVEVVLFGRGAR